MVTRGKTGSLFADAALTGHRRGPSGRWREPLNPRDALALLSTAVGADALTGFLLQLLAFAEQFLFPSRRADCRLFARLQPVDASNTPGGVGVRRGAVSAGSSPARAPFAAGRRSGPPCGRIPDRAAALVRPVPGHVIGYSPDTCVAGLARIPGSNLPGRPEGRVAWLCGRP